MESKLTGTWQAIQAELAAVPFPKAVTDTLQLKMNGNLYEVQNDSGTVNYLPNDRMEIKGVKGPNAGKTFLALYKLFGDDLSVCYDLAGGAWPKDFETKTGTQLLLVHYKKVS